MNFTHTLLNAAVGEYVAERRAGGVGGQGISDYEMPRAEIAYSPCDLYQLQQGSRWGC